MDDAGVKLAKKGLGSASQPACRCGGGQRWRVGRARLASKSRHALADSGQQAKGATIDVTLEPCSGFGRTPPCTKKSVKSRKVGESRHLNFFEHECYLKARVPRIKCGDGKVRLISPPWSGIVSGFTLLFEALVMQLCKAMPVHNVTQLTGASDYLIWQILDKYIAYVKIDQVNCACAREYTLGYEDFSSVDSIGMDETSIAKGHDYITLFVDLKKRVTLHVRKGKDNTKVADCIYVLESKSGCRN